jgi:hypothetical protein
LKRNLFYAGLLTFSAGIWTLSSALSAASAQGDPVILTLHDLSNFKEPGQSWQIAGDVRADLNKDQSILPASGQGVLVNNPSKKNKGTDLFTTAEFGDVEIELDFLTPKSGNSGIYLQGRYEVQIADSWNADQITSASNGGIYNLTPPRVNASKAPGLWQTLKIAFQAPRFDNNGNKTENARLLRVELNGVVIQENVELFAPTPGAVSNKEVAKAPLRIQGDHGAVAFRNIRFSSLNADRYAIDRGNAKDPILVEAPTTTVLRSFLNLDEGVKIVHAVSVGNPKNIHYSYDMDNGNIVQVWRGKFLDATPMWDGRGNGTSVPMGAVQRFGKPALSVAKLSDQSAAWPADTAGTQFRQKGYRVDLEGNPTFNYLIYGTKVEDVTEVRSDAKGVNRTVTAENSDGLYFLLARSSKIEDTGKGTYVIGDKDYYLEVSDTKNNKAFIRDHNGQKELIAPLNGKISYSILF